MKIKYEERTKEIQLGKINKDGILYLKCPTCNSGMKIRKISVTSFYECQKCTCAYTLYRDDELHEYLSDNFLERWWLRLLMWWTKNKVTYYLDLAIIPLRENK